MDDQHVPCMFVRIERQTGGSLIGAETLKCIKWWGQSKRMTALYIYIIYTVLSFVFDKSAHLSDSYHIDSIHIQWTLYLIVFRFNHNMAIIKIGK